MKLGTETGSLMNHVMSRAQNPEAKVGEGATILYWTDRQAATIIKVTEKQVHVQQDDATRIDKNGISENQEWKYKRNPKAYIDIFRMTKRGLRNKSGNGLLIGVRDEYYDYSF
jgi:hypothetical protein